MGKSIKEGLQEEDFEEFWQVEGHGEKRVGGWAPVLRNWQLTCPGWGATLRALTGCAEPVILVRPWPGHSAPLRSLPEEPTESKL